MSKYEIYDTDQMADIFKALSHPHRLSIFMRLVNCSSQEQTTSNDTQICECVGTLGKDLGIAPSTVSHHIKELRRAGLIVIRRRGQTLECSVDPEMLDLMAAFFEPRVQI
jgi:DNA-binding transcriptional ArsR family regulator